MKLKFLMQKRDQNPDLIQLINKIIYLHLYTNLRQKNLMAGR